MRLYFQFNFNNLLLFSFLFLANKTLYFPRFYGPFSNYLSVTSTPNLDEEAYSINRNKRASVRDFLISFVNNISISDLNSIRTQASLLFSLTMQPDEITRKSAVSRNKVNFISQYYAISFYSNNC
jgi:hypothetical protein